MTTRVDPSSGWCPSVREHSHLINHQKWQIGRLLDCSSPSPAFHLKDPYGCTHSVTEFFIEDVPESLQKELSCASAQQQRLLLQRFLQEQLNAATPYHVHVESHRGLLVLRFGSYGLKGGGKKDSYYACSALQVATGVVLCSTGVGAFFGGALISSGVSSGAKMYKMEEKDCSPRAYGQEVAVSLMSGLVSGSIGRLAKGAGWARTLLWQTIGGGAANVASSTGREYLEAHKSPDWKQVKTQALTGAIGGAAGTLGSALTDNLIGKVAEAGEGLLNQATHVMKVAGKGALSGAAGGVSSGLAGQATTNWHEGKEFSHRLEHVVGDSALMGAGSGLLTSGAEAFRKVRLQNDLAEAKKTRNEISENFGEASKTAEQAQRDVETTQKKLEKAEQNLAIEQTELQRLRSELEQRQLVATQTSQEVEQLQQRRALAEQSVEVSLKQFHLAQAEVHAAQQKAAALKEAVYHTFKDLADRGFHPKIQDPKTGSERYLKSHKRILDTLPELTERACRGEKIQWHHKDTRKSLQLDPRKFQELQTAQQDAAAAQQKVQTTTESLQQQQAELSAKQAQCSQKASEAAQLSQEVLATEATIQDQTHLVDFLGTKITAAQQRHLAAAQQKAALQAQSEIAELAAAKKQKAVTEAASRQTQQAELLRQQRSRAALLEALQPEPVSFVHNDCTMQELIPHVVLVHALHEALIGNCHEAFDWSRDSDSQYKALYCIKVAITPEGVLGSHLHLEKRAFRDSVPERPSIHWSWNQLVQPHGNMLDGMPQFSWEASLVAILEPLATFESSVSAKPFGVAPYDTFIFGSHTLSDRSTLLVSRAIEKEARAYLTGFRGRIVAFDGPIRPAIIEMLQTGYPEVWHLCDMQGNLTGKKARYAEEGYEKDEGYDNVTCIKKTNGQVVVLINEEGRGPAQRQSQSMQEYNAARRFIGLHLHAVTVWFEDRSYFKMVRQSAKDPTVVRGNSLFAGGIHNYDRLPYLGILEALCFSQKLLQADPETGAPEIAAYFLNEAMHADLVSLVYRHYPTHKVELSPLDLRMIFASVHSQLVALLESMLGALLPDHFVKPISLDKGESILNLIKQAREDSKQQAFGFFEQYRTMLLACYQAVLQAKEDALMWVSAAAVQDGMDETDSRQEILSVAKEEWDRVLVPHDIEFDLGRGWPHSEPLHLYATKVLHALPFDPQKYRLLYQSLSSSFKKTLVSKDRKEHYRLNVLCNLIQWEWQQRSYLERLRAVTGGDGVRVPLAEQLSRLAGWLAGYGLEPRNATREAGDYLFDSVIAQLPEGRTTNGQLRHDVIRFMQEHGDEYARCPDYMNGRLSVGDGGTQVSFSSWEEYLENMRKSRVWATELEVRALSFLLKGPVVLLSMDSRPKIYNPDGEGSPVFLQQDLMNHFDACVPLKGREARKIYTKIRQQEHD